MIANRAKKSERTDMTNALEAQNLSILGACALELIREEADRALGDVDWTALEGVDLDAWFERVLEQQRGVKPRRKRSLAHRVARYAAGIVLAVALSAAVVLAVYEPARAALIRFLIERFPENSLYSISYEKGEQSGKMVHVAPAYIPEGFVLRDSMVVDGVSDMDWINPTTQQFIGYYQSNGESPLMLDTENASVRSAPIHGTNAEVIEKGNTTTIQFFHGDMCFAIYTDLPYDECLKIAESIPIP